MVPERHIPATLISRQERKAIAKRLTFSWQPFIPGSRVALETRTNLIMTSQNSIISKTLWHWKRNENFPPGALKRFLRKKIRSQNVPPVDCGARISVWRGGRVHGKLRGWPWGFLSLFSDEKKNDLKMLSEMLSGMLSWMLSGMSSCFRSRKIFRSNTCFFLLSVCFWEDIVNDFLRITLNCF